MRAARTASVEQPNGGERGVARQVRRFCAEECQSYKECGAKVDADAAGFRRVAPNAKAV